MGTLTGHILPGLFLLAIGVFHLLRSTSSYTRSSRDYSARIWHPIASLRGRFKRLELYILLIALPIFIIHQLVVSIGFQSLLSVGLPSYRVLDFQHAAMLFAFWLVTIIVLLSDATLWLPLPGEAPFLLAAVAFGIEWMVLSEEIQGLGLEGKCNSIQANLAAAAAICSGLLAWKPRAFLADLVLCESLVLQGSWLVQTGMSLYVPRFIPDGCYKLLDLPSGIKGSTRCELDEARTRAFALMDLAFIVHLLLAMVVSSLLYCGVAKQRRSSGYDPLTAVDPESNLSSGNSVQMKPLPKQAQF